jgi:hypothetical protein
MMSLMIGSVAIPGERTPAVTSVSPIRGGAATRNSTAVIRTPATRRSSVLRLMLRTHERERQVWSDR